MDCSYSCCSHGSWKVAITVTDRSSFRKNLPKGQLQLQTDSEVFSNYFCNNFGARGISAESDVPRAKLQRNTCISRVEVRAKNGANWASSCFVRVARLQSEVGTNEFLKGTKFLTKNAPKCSRNV